MTKASDGRIHVLHVVLSLDPGGLENGVINVINGLNPEHFRSSVCCIQHTGEFAARIRVPCEIFEMNHTQGLDFSLPGRMARRFRELRPDVVHTRNTESFFYGFPAAKLARVPRIIHSEHGKAWAGKPVRRVVQRLFSAFTDHIFAVTGELRDNVSQHTSIPVRKIAVLYNGVDLDRFKSGDRDALRRRFGIGEKFIVGSVGRLAAIKNYELLVRAVGKIREKYDVALVLVGEGPERGKLEALSSELGVREHVYLLGHQNNTHELLPGLDIFVLPSTHEGMSNSLAEARAVGVCCVASNVGGNPELVHDGIDGILFPSGSLDALAGHLAALCEKPAVREQLGQAGKEDVRSRFGIATMIENYEKMYRRVHEH